MGRSPGAKWNIVRTDVCREKAATVLKDYRAAGGIIYNPRYRRPHGKAASESGSK
jgi:hypothetical protein